VALVRPPFANQRLVARVSPTQDRDSVVRAVWPVRGYDEFNYARLAKDNVYSTNIPMWLY
jgi:hypothetical protein